MRRNRQQETGDRGRATGDGQLEQMSRRGVFGALAGAVAVVAGLRRRRRETVVEQRRRKRFWIGHT
jgi:MYXO-CTERM domain-containing protein